MKRQKTEGKKTKLEYFPTHHLRAKEIRSERPGPPTYIQQWWVTADPAIGEWRGLERVPHNASNNFFEKTIIEEG